ncbi:rhodanese-like/PpiC domain-containing protein 12, chloroplastic [Hibiscus syriacus]|uniref:rhodanese-like/PpiC domain-containing protein 12, chloroplastic n=1 Tax=Hibiscus syriacus TaxID=106335 RepID=UPI001921A2B1|nr:rhodanese-like/PpiC domain-containing protein 12, chloroplastic [Hibiscus syriacus]
MLRASRFGRIASSLTNLVDLRRSLIPISLLFILIINLFTKSSLFLHFTLSSPLHLLLSAKPLPMRIIHNSDFQHLLLKEDGQKLLEELQQRIAGGRDLADLAVEYSICPSKEKGGMLGWVRKGQMVPEFEEAAFSAPLNKVVKCKTNFGWHLLQVLSEREESLLKDIEPEEFHAKLQDPSFIEQAQLIDVREPEEVSLASLPGFHVLPLRQVGSWGPEITNKFDPMKDTYVLCHHGRRSLQVAKWLHTQGFKEVFNVAGGIHAYAIKVDPPVPTY